VSAVLFVRPSSLGDVVWALSVAHDIAAARPATSLDWVAEEAFVALPAMCEQVRRVIPVALRRWRRDPFAGRTWREMRALRAALRAERYDAVIDAQEQVKGAVIARLARGPRHGLDRASIREPAATWLHDAHHAVARDLHFATKCRRLAAAALGYTIDGPPRWRWKLPPPPACTPDHPYVVAVHATSRADKRWPDARWRELLADVDASGFTIVLPHGSDDEERTSRALAAPLDRALVPPRLPLDAMAALLSHAHAVVGVDTGLTHLAAALGTSTLALFTVTEADLAGVAVAGAHARDLGGRGMIPTVEAARAALGELLRDAPRC
jgi:heptosyltransferase-1